MKKINRALEHLKKIRQTMAKVKSPYEGLSKSEVIEKIRQAREKIWKEKLAARS